MSAAIRREGRYFWLQMCHIWLEIPTRQLELVFSGFTGGWGAFVLCWWFSAFEGKHAYDLLGGMLPEWAWGAFAVAVAVMRIVGAVYLIRWLRITAAFLGIVLWGMMTVGVALSDPYSAGTVIFGWYDAVCVFLAVRLSWGRGAGER